MANKIIGGCPYTGCCGTCAESCETSNPDYMDCEMYFDLLGKRVELMGGETVDESVVPLLGREDATIAAMDDNLFELYIAEQLSKQDMALEKRL
jgi:hypothetical protein